MRLEIQKELNEFKEREKRKDCIIIRGLEYSDDFQREFKEISLLLTKKTISLTNIVPIRPNLVRATIQTAGDKFELLKNSSKLKHL